MSLSKQQKAFISELEREDVGGNITLACRNTGLARRTVYNWKRINPDFSRVWDCSIEAAKDLIADYAKGSLLQAVKRGNPAAIKYVLKTYRPDRYKY